MTQILESVFTSVLGVSSKAAMMAVVIGLLCLLLRRWIPAAWRHGLWLLVFLRLMMPDLGEFRWALPSWDKEASPSWTAVVHQASTPIEAAGHREEQVSVPNANSSSQEMMYPILPEEQFSEAPVPASAASTVPVPQYRAAASWMLIAAGLWLAGAATWWSCLLAGWLRFRSRVLRTSLPAPESMRQMLAESLALAGSRSRVRLRVTDKLHTPAICGLWHPVILLPAAAVHDLPSEKLRLLLLHELGHVHRMDVMVQVLTSLFLGLHWFNPLLWFAHHQLRAEAEAATDAWVLEHSGTGETRRYGEVLIDLAARCSWMGWLFFLAPSVIGAAESGGSLRSRIRAIAAYRRASRWSVITGIVCVGLMIATGMTQSPQRNADAITDTGTAAAETPTKAPEKPQETSATPQSNSGPTAVELATPGYFIAAKNRVVLKSGVTYPMPEPRQDMASDDIGGIVVDEGGQRVAGAKVNVRVLRRPAGYKDPAPVTSDAEGRWLMKGIPAGVEVSGASGRRNTNPEFKVTVSHPDYLSLDLYYHVPAPGPQTVDFRQGKAVLIMEKGLVMKGRVTDTEGKPVANAKIRRGFQERNIDDPTTMTDADGLYELKHARAGDCRMRIEAKDCAVWMKRVEIEKSGTWDFRLEPAKNLTVRVLDNKGRPIPEAYVVLQGSTDEAHGGGSIAWGAVDAEGKYSWAWTPPREVSARVSHKAYQNKIVPVKEESTDVVITLQPRHRLTLKIVDATSGKPVPDCTVERGQAFRRGPDQDVETAWPPNPPLKADAHGMLEDSLREEKELVAYRITVNGYTPHITRVLGEKDSSATEEVRLQPTKSLAVQLLQPDGRPASRAHVYALLRARGFIIKDLKELVPASNPSSNDPLEDSLEADEHGSCTLPTGSAETVIVVVHDSGFAFAYWRDVPRGTGWKLEPWARAEATVLEDGAPVAGVEYEYQGGMALPGQHWVNMVLKGTSDAQGRIVMPQVFPAKQAHFAEILPPSDPANTGTRNRRSFSQRVQDYEMKVTRSGETTHFDLTPMAGRSWTVVGRFVTESGPVSEGRLPRSFLMDKELSSAVGRSTFNMADIDRDGTFEIGPLTPGEYRIKLWDTDRPNFTVKSPALVLPEIPRGATPAQRRRDLGDVVLVDHSSPKAKVEVPEGRARFRVTVTDTAGKPLPGATIKPVAFRVKEGSGTRMNVKNEVLDLSENPVRTDATGVAEIECAAKVTDGTTLTELQLHVLCEGHVGTYAFFARANVKSTVALHKAGTVIAKVTWQGKPVESDRVRLTSSKAGSDADEGFIREAGGTHVNRCLREGPLLVQAAWKTEDGGLLFSKAAEVSVAIDKPATCILELQPGQRLKGRLDAQVPRPVKNARIGVCVLNVVNDEGGARISFRDWQEVREDGAFEFTSLPPGRIHVVVLADGWMHTHDPDGWNIVRPLPLTTPVPDEVVIPMALTASCQVLVLGKDDLPLPGVTVTASPNLNWDGRGNGRLDIRGPRLREALDEDPKKAPDWKNFFESWRTYQAVTDAEGRATISDLPAGVQRLHVLPNAWKPGEGFRPLAEGQSDEIALGQTGKAILRVTEKTAAQDSRR